MLMLQVDPDKTGKMVTPVFDCIVTTRSNHVAKPLALCCLRLELLALQSAGTTTYITK